MSSSQSSFSHTLVVPELLQEIGKYLTANEVATALQVCKDWQTSLLPLAARDVYISYTQNILPPFDLLARNSWRTQTMTIVGRPGRGQIEYFNLRGCTALKKFTWKSEEPALSLTTESQWERMIIFVRENRTAIESMTIEYRPPSLA
ncbi:hypothetical protein BGZ80_005713 [Entomortierella chlamydospora]|uniref:F-box domain-containing protein n=1 Tax=Entomortierella chlamydospora TaxID=101097 RepID=A0A9P6SUE2_9FUNG|nr:hypothetical protein BGZ80_005713 [Entomortierella chlamydospora]